MAAPTAAIRALNDRLQRAWQAGCGLLDAGHLDRDGLTGEEAIALRRADSEVAQLMKDREALLERTDRAEDLAGVTSELQRIAGPLHELESRNHAMHVRDFFAARSTVNDVEIDLSGAARAFSVYRDGARGADFVREFRLIAGDTGASGGSLTVPTTVANTIYAYMTAVNSVRRLARVVTTASGNPFRMPRVSTHAIATQVASTATAISQSDPVLSLVTMQAYDFGELVAVSEDLISDDNDIVTQFVAEQLGRAIGRASGAAYVVGTGSGQPQGIQTAAPGGSAGTIATGGSLILGPVGAAADKLEDVVRGVDPQYRQAGAAWLMNDLTMATIRKIRVGLGGTLDQYAFVPSPTAGLPGGQPDALCGHPVYFDSNVASMASDARIAYFGDWMSAYWIRDVAGLALSRSSDNLFDKRQWLFRGVLRTDGQVGDSAAAVTLHQAVS